MAIRPLAPIVYKPPLLISPPCGERPVFEWMPLTSLRVDDSYQHPIVDRGRRNIKDIVEHFDWTWFSPIIVAPIGKAGTPVYHYAVIDGQHRVTAALLHPDISEVPAIVMQCTPMEAARAFAHINGKVTKVTATQIYYAGVTGGDPACLAIRDCCDRAGVTILRLPPSLGRFKRGETMAVKTIGKAIDAHGPDITATAMMCVTETFDGWPGLLRSPVITGLAETLATMPEWCEAGERLFETLDDFDFEDAFEAARRKHNAIGGKIANHFAARVRGYLAGAGEKLANPAPEAAAE